MTSTAVKTLDNFCIVVVQLYCRISLILFWSGVNPQLVENSTQAEGKVRDIVAEKLGIGSSDTYRKEKYIVDNADTLTPEDFADWDEGKLSTNKAYLKIKEQLAARNANSPTIDTDIDLLGKAV